MEVRDLAIATHLIGMALWIGGIATAGVAASTLPTSSDGERAVYVAARRAVLMLATPGMLLAWIAGLAILVPDFGTLYARAGWMHAKLTLLLVLTGLTGVFTGRLRRAAQGRASGGALGAIGLGVLALAAIVAFLAVLRPF